MKEIHTKLVGQTFCRGSKARIITCREGDTLTLLREKDNKFDANAVEVYAGSGRVGYLSKKMAETIAPLMDKGIKVEATVTCVTGLHEKTQGLNMLVKYDEGS